ncbi:hypothetical protein [Amycolatopsis echigonensis]|uniref:Secreted protein n=1 Tax=Amycolatopsis echigonensis TaxID=2576905 RepID=A0A2N3WPK2_9PSEU|nr:MULTISPECIES: hypothetical protein [Amycolatopsis]MBB2502018.1 hypothetical protein [Amycolatopsis echigonensis]PKV95763.1 hypothetical protein ATK30_6693 [Amycolatopsis niigatensis]
MHGRAKKLIAAASAAVLAVAAAILGAGSASAYGGDGAMDVYQLAISFNCDNPAFCGSQNLGGFWGWGELDHNPATGANTGDAELTGCSHGAFNGAAHTSADVTKWWVGPGSAGPYTFFTDETDTTTSRGQTTVTKLTNDDIGVPAIPGHYSSSEIFGFTPPPGVSAQIQVSFKPAH